MRIGSKLLSLREDRKLNQAQMSDLLGVSTSVYARLERNETSAELDQLLYFSKKLQIPVQEFLPDTLTISSNNHKNQNGHIGLVMGNIYNYSDKDNLRSDLEKLEQENNFLKDKILSLQTEIENLKRIILLLEK